MTGIPAAARLACGAIRRSLRGNPTLAIGGGLIAVILGIARRTVATHVEHILAKLTVENRCAAARCASEVLFG